MKRFNVNNEKDGLPVSFFYFAEEAKDYAKDLNEAFGVSYYQVYEIKVNVSVRI